MNKKKKYEKTVEIFLMLQSPQMNNYMDIWSVWELACKIHEDYFGSSEEK